MLQKVIEGAASAADITCFLNSVNSVKPLLVCGSSFDKLILKPDIEPALKNAVRFGGFSPNPDYEDIVCGTRVFCEQGCDSIIAVGGGSAIDVAKCIKLFSGMDDSKCFLEQNGSDTGIPFIAIPTTAGSGSEATHNAVIYKEGVKQSVSHHSLLPDMAVLDWRVLKTLPDYQKKSTVLDALCQAIESWWSVNSTFQSRDIAKEAAITIKDNIEDYVTKGTEQSCKAIMKAANLAGNAIRLTKTTMPHAMAYKLTTTYGIAHGHAVALCLPNVWRLMIDNPGGCTDLRGWNFVSGVLKSMASDLGFQNEKEAVRWFEDLLELCKMEKPTALSAGDADMLADSVDCTKLKNSPVFMDRTILRDIYNRVIVY